MATKTFLLLLKITCDDAYSDPNEWNLEELLWPDEDTANDIMRGDYRLRLPEEGLEVVMCSKVEPEAEG